VYQYRYQSTYQFISFLAYAKICWNIQELTNIVQGRFFSNSLGSELPRYSRPVSLWHVVNAMPKTGTNTGCRATKYGFYQIIHLGENGTRVNNLPTVTTWWWVHHTLPPGLHFTRDHRGLTLARIIPKPQNPKSPSFPMTTFKFPTPVGEISQLQPCLPPCHTEYWTEDITTTVHAWSIKVG